MNASFLDDKHTVSRFRTIVQLSLRKHGITCKTFPNPCGSAKHQASGRYHGCEGHESDRLWNLNAVRVPDGVNEAAVRSALLSRHQIEIGAGLGPLAGRIWRVGLMGSGAIDANVDRLLGAFDDVMAKAG